jgi:hypothetical protein
MNMKGADYFGTMFSDILSRAKLRGYAMLTLPPMRQNIVQQVYNSRPRCKQVYNSRPRCKHKIQTNISLLNSIGRANLGNDGDNNVRLMKRYKGQSKSSRNCLSSIVVRHDLYRMYRLLVISTRKFCRDCLMKCGGRDTVSGRDSGFCITITAHRVLCRKILTEKKKNIPIITQPPHSPDLAPRDF